MFNLTKHKVNISMPTVDVQKCSSLEQAIRRIKRANERCGVSGKVRKSNRHEKPSTKRRRMKISAVKRYKKKEMKKLELLLLIRRRFRAK